MGAIVYEMATGRRAFDAESTPRILYRICYGSVDSLAQHRPDAPAALTQLLERALSRDASKRIVDAQTLRAELRDALASVAAATPDEGEPAPAAVAHADASAMSPLHTTLSSAVGETNGRSTASAPARTWMVWGGLAATAVLAGAIWVLPNVTSGPAPRELPTAAARPHLVEIPDASTVVPPAVSVVPSPVAAPTKSSSVIVSDQRVSPPALHKSPRRDRPKPKAPPPATVASPAAPAGPKATAVPAPPPPKPKDKFLPVE
jgi:serine/threonine-protein kinase